MIAQSDTFSYTEFRALMQTALAKLAGPNSAGEVLFPLDPHGDEGRTYIASSIASLGMVMALAPTDQNRQDSRRGQMTHAEFKGTLTAQFNECRNGVDRTLPPSLTSGLARIWTQTRLDKLQWAIEMLPTNEDVYF
jgi:hypothetical protein